MARIRTIKPDHGTNEKVGKLSDRAYRVWVGGLICQADDEGRVAVKFDEIKVKVYGFHPKVTIQNVKLAVFEIYKAGLIYLDQVDGKIYGQLHDWKSHQNVSHPSKSQIPEVSGRFAKVPESSRTFHWEGRKEGKEGRSVPKVPEPATPPTPNGGASPELPPLPPFLERNLKAAQRGRG